MTNVEEMFRKRFKIPDYQRAYSWDEEQIKQFLEDLREPADRYYLGHFLFEEGENSERLQDRRLQVIDGQQRITTCMIFFRAVVDVLGQFSNQEDCAQMSRVCSSYLYDSAWGTPGLKIVAYDDPYFQDTIVRGELGNFETKSQKRMSEALSYFKKNLRDLKVGEILRVTRKLIGATVTTYSVNDRAMAAQVFAFQNDRGKDLTMLEKIKSYFFLQLYLNSDRQTDIVTYIDSQFAGIYEQIINIDMDEDEVVNYYWRSQKGYNAGKTFDGIKGALSSLDRDGRIDWIRNFTSQLSASFKFIRLFQQDTDPFAIRLRVLGKPALSYPFMIKAHLLGAAYANDNTQKQEFGRLLRFLENITFRNNLRGTRADITARLHAFLQKFKNADSLTELIAEMVQGLKNDAWWRFWGDGAMKARLEGNDFYGNNAEYYFFWRYELYLRSDKGYGAPIRIDEMVSRTSIEHIAPQTENSKEKIKSGYGDYECENGIKSGGWLDSIGNLMLISAEQNSSIGNRPFSDKLASYESDSSPLLQQRKIKEYVTKKDGNPFWDVAAIKKRRTDLIEFFNTTWSLDGI